MNGGPHIGQEFKLLSEADWRIFVDVDNVLLVFAEDSVELHAAFAVAVDRD